MQVLLQKVTIVDPGSPHHGKTTDVLIKKNKIVSIQKGIPTEGSKVVQIKGACLSPGWLDIGAQIGEPGYEHREDLESISKAALAGGYTALAPFPNTNPTVDTSSLVSLMVNKSDALPIHLHPIAAVSQKCKGGDIAELMDMNNSGAVAFSDGQHSIDNQGLLLRALQYARRFDGLIIDQPLDRHMVEAFDIHEGKSSTMMGMKGQPSTAESSRVKRNLDLVEYSEGKLLLHLLSTAEGVDQIKEAKKKGLNVSSSVGAFNLCYTEEDMLSFNPNLKCDPPFRSKKDQRALVKGLRKGFISVIASQHTPIEEELKERAFSDADTGSIALQTTFPMLASQLRDDLELDLLIQAICHHPRQLLGIEVPAIDEGRVVEATLFHPDLSWTFENQLNHSLSKNTALIGQTFTGCVIGTFVKGRFHWNLDI